MSDDPFAVLGLSRGASSAELRAARRRLALLHHPDHGGDATAMQAVNSAFEQALLVVQADRRAGAEAARASEPARPRRWRWVEYDEASFVVDCGPSEATAVLAAVAAQIGMEVAVEREGAAVEAWLTEPAPCRCRLQVLADPVGSMVSLAVGWVDDAEAAPYPGIDAVRDRWIAGIDAWNLARRSVE